jgi:hypothetical protein
MSSLDDLEIRRLRPFERMCFVIYGMLWAVFVFLGLTFLKNILTTP